MSEYRDGTPKHWRPLIDRVYALAKQLDEELSGWQAGSAVDYGSFEEKAATWMRSFECELHAMALAQLDIDAPYIKVWGQAYRRTGRSPGKYRSMAGEITLERTVYRRLGSRGGKTIDAVGLRAGAVGDGWLPRTAQAMAHLIAKGTSREAASTATEMMRLPFSRCSFERVGHEVGAQYGRTQKRVEQALVEAYQVPEAASGISLAIDRVAVPMEEPIEEPDDPEWLFPHHAIQARSLKHRFKVSKHTQAALDEAKLQAAQAKPRKVARNWRMAYAATVTIHDLAGRALHTIRYGRMPKGNVESLCKRMVADVVQLRSARPDLTVTLLADGAPEMWRLYAAYFTKRNLGVKPTRLVDFWHLAEYAAAAARAMESEQKAWPGQWRRWKEKLLEEPGAIYAVLNDLRASGLAALEKARAAAAGASNQNQGDNPVVADAIRYIENRLGLMDYATARAAGLPIGSGSVEATCKSLVNMRMKRSGARWSHRGGSEVLQLRALMLSDRWAPGIGRALRPLRKSVAQITREEALAA